MFAETAELVRNASKPFKLNAEPGDKVVIVSDTAVAESVWAALFAAAHEQGLDPTLALIPPREKHGNDPTAAAREAMLAADLCLMVTSTAITHSEAGAAAQAAGVKCIAMDEMTPDILRSGAAGADYEAMQGIAQALGDIYAEGKVMRITSEHGTDVVGDIEGQTYWPIAGKIVENATQNICAFPDGEVGVAPDEGTTNGTVVWDTTVHGIGLLDEPIRLEVEDGWVTEVSGGRQADEFRETLEAADENAWYCAAEFSVGINPDAEVSGRMRTDKKVEGAVHIATGANKDLGGEIQSELHIDGTIRWPSVWVDDRQIVDHGEILVEPDE
ncbi:aminopeptidase [Haloferax sp. YSMS24]|uniref:aminopeptidase n=1 Tax=unclassified Haloferax TaxID=2625095 RepID=UPI00398CD7A0